MLTPERPYACDRCASSWPAGEHERFIEHLRREVARERDDGWTPVERTHRAWVEDEVRRRFGPAGAYLVDWYSCV